jgi:hypothetical protein
MQKDMKMLRKNAFLPELRTFQVSRHFCIDPKALLLSLCMAEGDEM